MYALYKNSKVFSTEDELTRKRAFGVNGISEPVFTMHDPGTP